LQSKYGTEKEMTMTPKNGENCWFVLSYGTDGRWLVRDVDHHRVLVGHLDDYGALAHSHTAWPDQVSAIIVLAVPTAPHLAELLQSLRAYGYLVIVVTTTVTGTGELPASAMETCRDAHGVAWIRGADLVRAGLVAEWHNVPALVSKAVEACYGVGPSDALVSIGREDILAVFAERPMLGIAVVDGLPVFPESDEPQPQDEAIARECVRASFARPLIGDVQTATYFIANIVGDASLMQMMEWASVLEQLVDENANIIWGVSLEEQTTETRMIVLGAHPWPSADGV
jgi:hypothetical protein